MPTRYSPPNLGVVSPDSKSSVRTVINGKQVDAVPYYTKEMLRQSKAEQDSRAAANSFMGRVTKGFTSPGVRTGDEERADIAHAAMNDANRMRMYTRKMERILEPTPSTGSISKSKKPSASKSSSVSKGAAPRR